MSARGSENTTESGSNFFSVEPEKAGVTRSGKKRLIPPDSDSEEPSAASLTSNLPGNQAVGTSPPAESLANLLPGPAGMSASNELEGTQVAGGSDRLQETEVVQSTEARESVTSDPMSEVSEVSDKVDSDTPPTMGDSDKEVVIVEESPTHFDANQLPKTIEAGRFRAIIVRAQSLRTQIQKGLNNMDRCIAQLVELEKEGDDSDGDEFIEGLYKEIGTEHAKVKVNLSEHETLTSQTRVMCGFIIETRSNLPNAQKVRGEAIEALAKAEEAERLVEKKVTEWGKENLKWIRGKKKKKPEKSNTTPDAGGEVRIKSA